jgi:glycerol-3-phosphate acyltransferase PlsY
VASTGLEDRRVLLHVGALVAGYLIGSIPFGVLAGRSTAGVDPRDHGSGGSGATNVLRVVGRRAALVVLVADIAKGYLTVWGAFRLGGGSEAVALLAASGVVLGHVWPLFARFRGGKGVAAAAGAFLALDPLAGAIGLGVFAVTLALRRIVSLASILAVVLLPAVLGALDVAGLHPVSAGLLAFSGGLAALVLLTHRANLQRIVAGTEPRL